MIHISSPQETMPCKLTSPYSPPPLDQSDEASCRAEDLGQSRKLDTLGIISIHLSYLHQIRNSNLGLKKPLSLLNPSKTYTLLATVAGRRHAQNRRPNNPSRWSCTGGTPSYFQQFGAPYTCNTRSLIYSLKSNLRRRYIVKRVH